MTKPKPKDQLQKRGRKPLFRPEYILIAKAAARRDVQNIDHAVGVYHISEAPMTEEDWIRETSNGKQLDLEAKAIEHDANERKSNS